MSRRWILTALLAIGGVALMSLAAYNFQAVYYCEPIHLTLSGGNVCPLRSEMAKRICGEVRDSGIVLQPVSDLNSESIAADVEEGRIDLGLVLGGFSAEDFPHIRQVAALGVEPLHLLVRKSLVQHSSPSLEALRGRRVSLGERDSNGQILASDLLRFAGFESRSEENEGDYIAVFNTEDDLFKQLRLLKDATPSVRLVVEASLPEAIFLVDSMPSVLVDQLVQNGYVLVPLPYATALQLDSRRDHHSEGHRLDRSRVQAVTIPAYTYGIDPASPAQDCPTLGLRLVLLTHETTPTKAIVKLLRSLDQCMGQRYYVNLNATSAEGEFPLHSGAVAFANEQRPVSADEVLEPLGDLLSVIGAAAAGAIALWGFLRSLKKVNPDVHLRQIDRIERLLHGSESDDEAPTIPLDFINFLETKLSQIKQAAIEDYSHGRYQNDDALVSILTMIADTRHLLVQRRKHILAHESGSVRMSNAA